MKKQTIFWITGLAIVLFLFIQVITSTYITSYSSTDLGIISKLPFTFWIGLILLGVLLFAGRKSEKHTIIVVILIFLYVFVIPTIVVENKAAWLSISYYRSTQVDFIISEGYLPFDQIQPWELLNWPGYFFISASLSLVTGLPTTWFAQFFPLLTLALLGIVAYSVLKIKLNTTHSCLGALLVLGCFFSGQQYFCPQAIAYLMYIAIILLTAKLFFTKTKNASLVATVILLFFGAVITHLLTSFAILATILVLYFFKVTLLRKIKLSSFFSLLICILFASIFFLYQTTIIGNSFSEIVQALYMQLSAGGSDISNVGLSNRVVGSTAFQLELFGTYSIALIMLAMAAVSVLILFYGMLKRKPDAKTELFWIAWIIISGVLGVSLSYGGEGVIRAFMFMVIPICYLAVKYLSKKPKILLFILLILLLIHFPAAYTRDNYLYLPTSELKGANALSQYTSADAAVNIYYEYLASTPFFPNEHRIFINMEKLVGLHSIPSAENISAALGDCTIIIISHVQSNYYQYFYGYDILTNYDFSQNQSCIYDNGNYTIFFKTDYTS